MISKQISLDEKVNALSDDTCRLLFTWLITHLDCEGRMHGDSTTVKSIVFPRRNISALKIEKYLKELEKNELIFRYLINGNQYLFMKNFEKHQTGLQKDREAQSQIPPFTPELIQSKEGLGHSEVKVKVKVKDNKEKSIKRNYGGFENVLLTTAELGKLHDELGVAVTLTYVERLSEYIKSRGIKRYKSHYATILQWHRKDKEGKSGKAHNPRGLPPRYTEPPDYGD